MGILKDWPPTNKKGAIDWSAMKSEKVVDPFDVPEFVEWFKAQPTAIKKAIRARPPGRLYKIQHSIFPGYVVSYEGPDDDSGTVTFKVNVLSSRLPSVVWRTLRGLIANDLQPWNDDDMDGMLRMTRLNWVLSQEEGKQRA